MKVVAMEAETITSLIIQAAVAIVVIVAFVWRIPSKDDLKRVEDKADNANRQNLEIRGDIKVLTEKVERIEGYFDIPELKSGRRASGTDE